MNKETKAALYVVGLLCAFTLGFVAASKPAEVRRATNRDSAATTSINYNIRNAELALISADLEEYKDLSKDMREQIIRAIDSTSKEFRLPVMLIHAIIRIESEYKIDAAHPEVTTTVAGKKTKIKAAGLGGIVWEIWEDSLKAKGIAETRTDLLFPESNIRATGYILRDATDKIMKSPTSERTIVRKIIRQYYGAYSVPYENRMEKVTSDLSMKRIARDLRKS